MRPCRPTKTRWTARRRAPPPVKPSRRADGIRLAGWYIPSGSGTGPTGPTVVLVHGWGSNKSAMLDQAAVLHDRYNLLIVDLRNHGQSEAAPTTQGVREASDVEAFVDWLETTKAPEQIALFGVSMGGVTVLNEADSDERIDAVIIESTHATMANAIQARLEQAGYPLSLPGSWAVLLGTLVRTGQDVSSADAGPGDRPARRAPRADRQRRPGRHDRRERRRRPARRGRGGRVAGGAATSARKPVTRKASRPARRTIRAGC